MHAFVYLRVRHSLPGIAWVRWTAIGFCAAMVLSPIGARFLAETGFHLPGRVLGLVSLMWMGMLTLAVFGTAVLRVGDGILALSRHRFGARVPASTGGIGVALLTAVVVLATVYGVFESGRLVVERVVIESPRLAADAAPLRIVQISDVHVGNLVSGKRARKVADAVQRQKPDLIVCTGDLIDGPMPDEDEVAAAFASMEAPLGKFAITGNHEVYYGEQEAIGFMERCGFRVLDTRSARVDERLVVVGISETYYYDKQPEAPVLAEARGPGFSLLLKHQPVIDQASLGLFDLQLSGHTHGGQIWPMHHVVGLFYPHLAGMYRLDKGSAVYTSRGTATWGPQMRIFSPPELTVIEIRPLS